MMNEAHKCRNTSESLLAKPYDDSSSNAKRESSSSSGVSMTLPNLPSSQGQYIPTGLQPGVEISNPPGNGSPNVSPKHSPRQTHKQEKLDISPRDPSPYFIEKLEVADQQDSILKKSTDSIQSPELVRSVSHESSKERKESRGSDRSKKKSYWYNVLYPTYKSRSDEFKRYFKDVPTDERLIVDYSCALQRDILLHGRLYVTQNYLCFYANIFRWETCVCIKWKDVTSVAKGKTALVIPNAILVSTDTEKHFLTTFGARDKAYMMLFRVWQNALMDQPMSTQEMWHWVHTAYGDELGLTSDDEDYNYIPPGPSFDEKLCPAGVRLSADSLSEQECRSLYGSGLEKGGSEMGSSATDSTNKSQTSIPAQPGFLVDSTPSPNGLEVDHLPTDISDTSDDDAEKNPDKHDVHWERDRESKKVSRRQQQLSPFPQRDGPELKAVQCSSSHEGRLLVSLVLPVHIDQLFTLLFTNSKFFVEFHALRRTTDIKVSSWQPGEGDEKMRTVTMVVALNQTLGPRTANVQETQVMHASSRPGIFYAIDSEAVNSGIPYADSFYVLTHTCLVKSGENETTLTVHSELKYKKHVWGLVKNIIEKNSWAGLEDFHDGLVKSLQAECVDPVLLKGRKSRRRQRSLINKPVLLPVDELPTHSRTASVFKTASKRQDGEKSSDVLISIVLAVLVFLVLLNGLLYYKLWILEDWTQSSRLGLAQDLAYLEVLKNPPKSHEEWLELLRHQESLHRMELDKWQKVLQTAVQLLRRAEDALNSLEGSIRSSYAEEVLSAFNKNERQEL